jgi:hypothetical protein
VPQGVGPDIKSQYCKKKKKKKKNFVICRKMYGTGDHNVKPDMPSSATQITHIITNMWNIDLKK